MTVTLALAVLLTAVCSSYAASVLAKRLGLSGIRAETLRRVCVGMSGASAGLVLLAVGLVLDGDRSRGTVLTFGALLVAFGGRDLLWPLMRPRRETVSEELPRETSSRDREPR